MLKNQRKSLNNYNFGLTFISNTACNPFVYLIFIFRIQHLKYFSHVGYITKQNTQSQYKTNEKHFFIVIWTLWTRHRFRYKKNTTHIHVAIKFWNNAYDIQFNWSKFSYIKEKKNVYISKRKIINCARKYGRVQRVLNLHWL